MAFPWSFHVLHSTAQFRTFAVRHCIYHITSLSTLAVSYFIYMLTKNLVYLCISRIFMLCLFDSTDSFFFVCLFIILKQNSKQNSEWITSFFQSYAFVFVFALLLHSHSVQCTHLSIELTLGTHTPFTAPFRYQIDTNIRFYHASSYRIIRYFHWIQVNTQRQQR